ncbi:MULTISPECIES: O-antigen ligase family protein [Vibrio]|uniref:O-antigen ligase family protein n=1 Tax=Vibrio TaxID=662 RepID=UPI00215CA8A8|nr:MULTISPECIES: O-antigen ligase family protein [Vibrio]MCR9533323.1 hypothetical protein [Vibrio alginolyticus]
MLALRDYVPFWMLLSVLYQAGVSFYGSSVIFSAVNQLFFLAFVVLSLSLSRLFKFSTLNIVLFIFLCLTVIVNAFIGKSFSILAFGLLDNFKFLLMLFLVICMPKDIWKMSSIGVFFVTAMYYLIIISILFGVLQQLAKELIYIFPSSIGFREMYRYGILRVPSFFASINAFAKIAFLLIPIALLLKKNMKIAICWSVLAFILTFSRQFILGCIFSIVMAYVFSGRIDVKKITTISLILLLSITSLFLISWFGSDNANNESVDGKLLSIPDRYIRTAVMITSIKASIDNPVFGVGPGYFGGNIGKKFELNDELENYGMMDLIPFFDLSGPYYTDTLWPQLLGEFGIIGFSVIVYFFWLWFRLILSTTSFQHRLISLFCFFQFIFVGLMSPAFNYYYFTVPMLFLTLYLSNIEKDYI